MRVLSLNCWGGRLHEPLIDYLAHADADVLCLQEVVHTRGRPAGWLVYRDIGVELPQRAAMFDEISALLPDHQAFFAPTARGLLHDGDTPVLCEFGLATFVRKSLAVIGQAMDFVHGAFSPDGWGPHPRARNAQCLRLFDYEHCYAITVAQLHGLRDMAGKGDTPARDAQTKALTALIRRIWLGDERLVVCGDFNVLPESGMFPALAELGLTDLVVSRGHTDTRTSYYEKPGRYADYMLVTPDVEVIAFDAVAEPEVSDHRVLLLEMR